MTFNMYLVFLPHLCNSRISFIIHPTSHSTFNQQILLSICHILDSVQHTRNQNIITNFSAFRGFNSMNNHLITTACYALGKILKIQK